MRYLIWLLGLSLLANETIAANAAARKSSPRPPAAKPKPSTSEVLAQAIVANIPRKNENLLAACSRMRPLSLFSGIEPFARGLNAEKGEFETTEAFEARRKSAVAALQSAGKMMFCRSLADEDLAFNYDSDNERFSMLKSSLNGFSAHYVFKKYPSYATKTRMGVPFRVYPSIAVDWRLSFSWGYRTTCIDESYQSRFFVPQPIADAPRLKASGRLVVFGDFSPPYYGSEDINPVPSLTEPEVTSSRTITLHIKAHRAAIIDASGKELWSCDTMHTLDSMQSKRLSINDLEHSARNSRNADALNAALSRLGKNPKDVAALVDAGNAALALGNVDAAVGFFARADQVQPNTPQVRAGLAGALVHIGTPYDAIPLFTEAEAAGAMDKRLNAERGLAYDLIGDNATAQKYYNEALLAGPSDEVTRRLALSQAIAGERNAMEATLSPLLAKQDKAAWRTRAFALAILGRSDEAVTIAYQTMPQDLAAGMAPYLRYMPRLTKAQQAAAATFGHFPLAAHIGLDDPHAQRTASSDIDVVGLLRQVQRNSASAPGNGDDEYFSLFKSW